MTENWKIINPFFTEGNYIAINIKTRKKKRFYFHDYSEYFKTYCSLNNMKLGDNKISKELIKDYAIYNEKRLEKWLEDRNKFTKRTQIVKSDKSLRENNVKSDKNASNKKINWFTKFISRIRKIFVRGEK